MAAPTVTIEQADGRTAVALAGSLLVGGVDAMLAQLAAVRGPGEVVLDLSRLDRLDTAGAWALIELRHRLEGEGVKVELHGLDATRQSLIDLVARTIPAEAAPRRTHRGLLDWIADVGEATAGAVEVARAITGLLGAVVAALAGTVVRPWRLRFTSLVFHMQEVGLNAVPIASLMAFLIGVVLAFQGATQLRQFGAEVFVVDLIAISVLRELGILLTAIIVAGRSASAFTAAIGSMKMREEIDAMRTLGLDPIDILVVPRVLALILTLPLLGFLADMAGLVGGAAMSWISLGVSPGMFMARLQYAADGWQFAVGILKAPFFALIIGLIGCYEGMMVEGNAESLGRNTSKSVVLAIFLVIVADAAFSIFFALVGV
jgi:phospholipid/cholesterol/gamma-HCH transport system permease protein